jgi:two-component system invasion response regulator UvrY
MLSLGARGFVTKTSTLDELKTAILKVHGGEIYVCEEIKKKERKG